MSVIDATEREAMRESFARLLAARCSEADCRRIMAGDSAHDPDLWAEMAQLGVLAMLVPTEYGGLGGGPRESELLMEEAGRVLLPGPFFSSAVLATLLLSESVDEAAKARLLPSLAEGRLIGTAAIAGEAGLWDGSDGQVIASPGPDGVRLSGFACYVSDGALADLLLVVAGKGDERELFEVTARDGLTITALKTFDPTQRLARLDFAGVPARKIEGACGAAIGRAIDQARVALTGRQAGAAAQNFAFTVEYIRTRVQFGRPIGGFQAIKHMAADLLVESETAITAARHGAELNADSAPGATEALAMASFAVSEAQVRIAADAIQMHGGIAFTWEHPAHLYFRRAQHDTWYLGSSEQAREQFVRELEKAA